MEVDLPLWEKMRKDEVQVKYEQEYRAWKEQPDKFKMVLPDGQEHYPVLSLYDQAKQFWQSLISQYQNKTVLIVAHNGINRCLIMSAVGITPDRYHSIQQSNCCVNVLNFSGDFGAPVSYTHLTLPTILLV